MKRKVKQAKKKRLMNIQLRPINIIKRFMMKKERIYDKTERDGKDCF